MTSPVDTSVKFFTSEMSGAPTLNGVAGSMIGVLDACLVDGFGLKSLTSLVVASGIATATFAGGASAARVGTVVLIAGATPSGLNGEQKVLSANATTVTFATAQADTTATGTITMKMAPAAWLKSFSGTNLAAYKSADVGSTACLLRVDDSGTTVARVVGFQTMSDISTGTGQFPTNTQVSGGNYWTKSNSANSTPQRWYLVTDGRMFYFGRAYRSGASGLLLEYELTVFGDFLSTKSADPYGCILSGMTTNVASAAIDSSANYWYGAQQSAAGLYCVRSYTALGGSVPMGKTYPTLNGNTSPNTSGASAAGTPFPNPADGGLYVMPHYVFEGVTGTSNNVHRGVSPGFYCTPHSIPNGVFAPSDTVTGVTGLTDKTLLAQTCQSTTNGVVFFDITGPWR